MLCIIKSLYKNVRACIKHQGTLTDTFRISAGVLQGEILSPVLFSMYLNDFERHFIENNCASVELQMINLFLIMYADDTVLIAESVESLQEMLNTLYRYTKEWNLTVNVQKTKIVVFRNGKYVRDEEKWTYDGKNVEVVNQFNYLGLLFNYTVKNVFR